jgi:6-phosphogluconate dehydrogenase
VSQAALLGILIPAFFTALTFYNGYRTAHLSANLLQAQRAYFGAHTYWTGRDDNVFSTSYNA